MKLLEEKDYALIKDVFSSEVIAGFTKPAFNSSLPEDVYKFFPSLVSRSLLSHMSQPHSGIVCFSDKSGVYHGDAIFTKSLNHFLIVKTADCLPLFFSSDELGVVGVVHMSWRCARDKILTNIPFDLSPFKVVAGIGLRRCCYEVSEDFLTYGWLGSCFERRETKLYFNPVVFAKKILIEKGLKEQSFSDLGICSFCSSEEFPSYRKTSTNERTLSFILRKISLHL